jgi:hypothetical protein
MGLFNILLNKEKTFDQTKKSYVDLGEYNSEFSLLMPDYLDGEYKYSYFGVMIIPMSDVLRIVYTGILAQNGANKVYAVIGYGESTNWQNTNTIQLQSSGKSTFEATLPVHGNGNINIAFKDDANNWDNNNGMNYIFTDQNFS